MRKFKIKSKTPENIIKTKIPDDSKQDFILPPQKNVISKKPDKKSIHIPSNSGLKAIIDNRDNNTSLPKEVKERKKSKFLPRNNGKKTDDEKNSKKMNKSLPLIANKKPKKNEEFKKIKKSLETPEKINVLMSKEIRSKRPKESAKKTSPPKFSVNPPKTKIKEKSP